LFAGLKLSSHQVTQIKKLCRPVCQIHVKNLKMNNICMGNFFCPYARLLIVWVHTETTGFRQTMCEHTFIDIIQYNSMLAYFGRTFHLAFLECLSTFHLCLYHCFHVSKILSSSGIIIHNYSVNQVCSKIQNNSGIKHHCCVSQRCVFIWNYFSLMAVTANNISKKSSYSLICLLNRCMTE